jgi:peptidyl-tRNA hydrolase, PTH1 family
VKVIAGLGNPGARYDNTRHNVGWWVLDRICHDFDLGPFHPEGAALVASGDVDGEAVILVKPTAYMNRSGPALLPFLESAECDPEEDLLVIVDDAALDVGRVRFRGSGSAGGHNGLVSVAAALNTHRYTRLRVGVGRPPAGADMVDWVLSPMSAADEERVLEILPDLSEAVGRWVSEGVESVMNRYNR